MSLQSAVAQERESSKDSLEYAGARAFFRGKKKSANPYISAVERSDMEEFSPWQPACGNSNLSAYYWFLG